MSGREVNRRRSAASGSRVKRSIVSRLPMASFRESREALIDTYAHFFTQISEAQENMAEFSNEEIREMNRRSARDAPNYDPHPKNSLLTAWLERLGTTWTIISYLLITIGAALSVQTLISIGMEMRQLPGLVWNVGPSVLLAAIGLVMYYLRTDTFLHQTLNEELKVDGARLCTRDRSKLVGYKVWNDGLHGQKALILLTLVFFLDSIPHLPLIRRLCSNPRERVLGLIRRNATTLYDSDSTFEATKMVLNSKEDLRDILGKRP